MQTKCLLNLRTVVGHLLWNHGVLALRTEWTVLTSLMVLSPRMRRCSFMKYEIKRIKEENQNVAEGRRGAAVEPGMVKSHCSRLWELS